MDKTLIIAEAGVNHNGSMDIAKKLIDVAKDSGADIVKFQTFKAENLVTKTATKAEYQKVGTDDDEYQFKMLKRLELDVDNHYELINYCKQIGIQFLSTAFDIDSMKLLEQFSLPLNKIPSGEITNLPYLRYVGSLGNQIILSSGMSTLNEIDAALNVLINAGSKKENIIILHCNTAYPTPMTDVNLKAMLAIQKKLGVKVGYSDHTKGIEVAIAAVSMGAIVIEKHFTLKRSLPGPDHAASLEPNELKRMVKAIRNIELALGIEEKKSAQVKVKISILLESLL